MAIKRVAIKDFLVFKGEFSVDFCEGVNIFIGGNGTGKTTLLRVLYRYHADTRPLNDYDKDYVLLAFDKEKISVQSDFTDAEDVTTTRIGDAKLVKGIKAVFIPEKDFLSHAKGLPETARYGNAELTNFEIDIIEKARVLASTPEQPLYRKICDLIGGEPEHDGQRFFMKRQNIAEAIPFSMEASGYRKFGLLAMLIRNEMIKRGSVLFWDEPENSLNPNLVPQLVEILLELSRNEIQIIIATHSEILASYFAVKRQKDDKVMFASLYKDGERIKADLNDRFDLLEPNTLTEEYVKLYEKEIEKGLGRNG